MTRKILSGTALALVLATPGLAQERQAMTDPCTEYEVNARLESLMADGYGRVCELIGHSRVTGDCMNYYLRITAKGPLMALGDDARAALAAACEASQPGGTALGYSDCASGAECLAADIEPMPDGPGAMEPDGTMECGAGMVECVDPDWPEEPVDDVSDGGAGPGAMDPDGTMECGAGMVECVDPDWPEEPVDDVSGGGAGTVGDPLAQAAPTADPALDLAFWESIKDSDTPALFQAYLDQFPTGVFRPIAEVRLADLAAPAPADPALAPAPADSNDPAALYARAEALLDAMYARDVSDWDAAAQEPLRLLRLAAEGGKPEAILALGELVETGIGVAQDNDRAAGLYLEAAGAGVTEGYFRALMVLDQIGDNTGFVSTFVAAYRAAPATLRASLPDYSATALGWVQAFLGAKRFYTGAIDGAFGPGSQAALDAYVSGQAPAAAPAPAPAADDSLARALQTELARVGCYDGAIDGKWGPGSARAMRNFNHWSGEIADTDRPTAYGLEVTSQTSTLVCGVD